MRITYSARCWVAAIMLPITSIAKGAVDFVDCMLITDLSDPIFLHHTATGAPLEAEAFIGSLTKYRGMYYDNNFAYNNIFKQLVADFDAINNVFSRKEAMSHLQDKLPDVALELAPFDQKPICLWLPLSIGHYDFDTGLFPINYNNYGYISSGQIGSGYNLEIGDSVTGYDKYFRPSSVEQSRTIEGIISEAGGLKALFVFAPVSANQVKDDRTLTLRPVKVEIHSAESFRYVNVAGQKHPMAIVFAPPLFELTHPNAVRM